MAGFTRVFRSTPALLPIFIGSFAAHGQSVAFPSDSGVVDVTNWSSDPTLLAIPDDGIDDTAAIQAALDAFGGTKAIVYLPDGQYDLSDSLVFNRVSNQALAVRTVLQGQSRDGVVLKLQDNLTRSDGSAFDGAVLTVGDNQPGSGAADYFQNVVRNLTFNIGSGNAGASGLEFNASNQGTARDLKIVSGDGGGKIGLDLGFRDNIGPLLVKSVEVEGFDTGIRSLSQANSKVLEDIVVRNQNVVGLENSSTSTIQVRNFRSENDVTAISNSLPLANGGAGNPGNGRLVLTDAQLLGAGGQSLTSAAIVNANGNSAPQFYARNVEIQNYDIAVSSPQLTGQGNRSIRTDLIEEYWHNGTAGSARRGGAFQLFDNSPDTSLGLAVRETPDSPIDNVNNWVSPLDFGGVPDDGIDDSAAIQAAIDSGARTVYLSNGAWDLHENVVLRGNVERLLGTEADILSTNQALAAGKGRIIIGDGTADTVFVERLAATGAAGPLSPTVKYEHASDRDLVVKHVTGFSYDPGTGERGDVYLEDVNVAGREAIVFKDQNVWARQLNVETFADAGDPDAPEAKVINDGANVWVLGYKTERTGTLVKTINGGATEVLGLYRNGGGLSDANNPAFVTIDSAVSVAGFSVVPGDPGWSVFARETRNGVTVESSTNNEADLYTGFGDDVLWDIRQEIYLDNGDTRGVTLNGDWNESESFPGGFIGENFSFSDDPSASAEYRPDFPVDGEYEVLIRLVGDWFNQDHSGHSALTPITILSEDGTETIIFDQGGFELEDSGLWVSLGAYLFAMGENQGLAIGASLSLDPDFDNIIADGVRFVLVPEPGMAIWILGLLCGLIRRRPAAAV